MGVEDYFVVSEPNIDTNEELREPQIIAYYRVYEHFNIRRKESHAILILPTGVGKTGLMGILPYGISKGRVLIITPQLMIKDEVVDSLNPDNPNNFWLKRKVFKDIDNLPALSEYEGTKTSREVLDLSNMVVLNIQKLQGRLDSSPLNFLPNNYFDMIIIDEAHHSTANSWVETIQHFSSAKVVKLTATPLRSDNKEIAGELVYRYKLSQAMANNYVKSLRNNSYIPEKLYLTVGEDTSKKYTVEELLEQGIKDEDYVSRSVAYSIECSKKVVEESIKLLEEKLKDNNPIPHKIIAVACGIEHAKQIKKLYEEYEYEATIIHSKLSNEEIEKAKSDINNNRVKVVINVAMLGEGYDHPYLSVAAIFRPFRNSLPYEQFVGRILRRINDDNATRASDNIGDIISHKHLGLEDMWQKYKIEVEESEIIKKIREEDELQETIERTSSNKDEVDEVDIGIASEDGQGATTRVDFVDTEIIRRNREEEKIREEKIKGIQEILKVERERAIQILNTTEGINNNIKRPDQYFSRKRKDIDSRIKEDIVPSIIAKNSIDKNGVELKNCRLFTNKYRWISNRIKNNGGMLAVYFETYLKNTMGIPKSEWKLSDYDIANEKLDEVVEYVEKVIESFMNLR
ncbi:superfamily II DNA or RNA helicase [Clostridium saccharoperbutylacetonicum]|uniref:DNA or RNA helicase of superfamily II n=1 Tax=Clostridium saccharoperbutylacetonicum N1-4(HMT) TaxID=931276 RepID=M1MTI7_9CLOT|nr:DEAD/DEAH box helicase family protein [Clostridium saccharoperbutylacetonicum]AGF59433.1 DNA or RNA helicase of superfamily II [Clostridium saccharoperbutylacetonicum N1-4(HMT)]NRT59774.1 superfamily II DNA or RNA helicase [Clostridium saccharoperbutylacetonicum]NSB23086.1 superfamily II DNA or RNA helicase [Clostridium saccharoperbutylacetonicum]NSB42457.1 superfamily II DNA or RNA helicase [Clostridium saccharoperbutylacetonicum]